MIRHVHETHHGRCEIELTGGERQFQCARNGISDTEGLARFRLSGIADQRWRDIDRGQMRPARGETPGIVAFPTTGVQSFLPATSCNGSMNAGRFTASR